MAVIIDEMHVDVKDVPAPQGSTPEPKAEKPPDLHGALEKLKERKLRVRAD